MAALRNAVLNVVGEAQWGFATALISSATVLTLLLQTHGAGERSIALVSAIDAGLLLLPQVLGPFVFTAHGPARVRQIVRWHLFPMIPCLFALAALAWWGGRLPSGWAPSLILLAWASFVFSIGVVTAVWMDWIASLIPDRIRGTVMGLGWGASSAAGILGALIAGQCIADMPPSAAFTLLYAAAGILCVAAILIFIAMRSLVPQEERPPSRPRVADLCRRIGLSLREPGMRALLIGRVLAWCGAGYVPFIALHYRSTAGGGLADGTIVSAGAAMTLGGAIGCLVLGRLGDLRGHRIGNLIGIAGQCAALAALLWQPGLPGCLIAFTGAGLAGAGILISHTNLMLEGCPHDDRVAHLVAGNLVCGCVACCVPFAVGPLVDAWGTGPYFKVALAVSSAALVWSMLLTRDPRQIRR